MRTGGISRSCAETGLLSVCMGEVTGAATGGGLAFAVPAPVTRKSICAGIAGCMLCLGAIAEPAGIDDGAPSKPAALAGRTRFNASTATNPAFAAR